MRLLEAGGVAVAIVAVASQNLVLLAFGLSLISLGIGTLALVRVTNLAKHQQDIHASQATALGDLHGRAARVDQKLGGDSGDP